MRNVSKPTPPSAFVNATNGLSITTGIAVAFVLAPQVYHLGVLWVGEYTATEYGAELVEASRILFLGVAAWFVFCLARLICAIFLSSLGLWLGTVLLNRSRKD